MNTALPVALYGCVLALTTAACTQRASDATRSVAFGDSRQGAVLIEHYACGACHTIPGINGAHGRVGPPLDFFSQRTFIAGQLPNTPPNLVRWLRNPPAIAPNTAMPDLGIDEPAARDIAAYLMTLR